MSLVRSSSAWDGHGKLGGKSAGLFLAKKIIDKAPEASSLLHQVKVPRTWYLTSDWIQNFVPRIPSWSTARSTAMPQPQSIPATKRAGIPT